MSKWIEHVKAYAAEHGVAYKDALKSAAATYTKKARQPKPVRTGPTWLEHVREYRKKHPEMSYKDALHNARPSYRKH